MITDVNSFLIIMFGITFALAIGSILFLLVRGDK